MYGDPFFICTVAEINECLLGIHNCMQVCENVNGSFACSCETGYALNPDGYTCRGIEILVHNFTQKKASRDCLE